MKIEMGESLAATWLKHIKGCVLVQGNWKASPRWEEHNMPEIERLVAEGRDFFGDLNVFRGADTATQQLHLAECDVIGLSCEGGNYVWRSVEIAFHENGLQYGNRYETAAKVAAKLFRAAIGLYCYMNTTSGEIYFATPKITNSYLRQIVPAVERVAQFFADRGFGFVFRLISDEAFKDDILNPVVQLRDEVADTSELFLRAVQLLNLFGEGRGAVGLADDPEPVASGGEGQVKVGRLANTVLRVVLPDLSPDEIENLLDLEFSRQAFALNYPLLVRVGDVFPQERYYAQPVEISGISYRICNNWFPRNRGLLEAWIASHRRG